MARRTKIEILGLAERCLELYFDLGHSVHSTAEHLTNELAERDGEDQSVHHATVARFVAAVKKDQATQAREQYKNFAHSTMPSDLDSLEKAKEWHLDIFTDSQQEHKRRRNAANDLVKVVETKLKLALACDPGDKTQVLSIVKNEVVDVGSGSQGSPFPLEMFADNPVPFGEVVLGETYTDDVKNLMESVRDNPVTIAKSANATGKTHAAARIAVWWYKTRKECQIYTAAAPPESNLKKLLWGEIGTLIERNESLFEKDSRQSLHVSRGAQTFVTGVTIPMSGTESQREAKFSGKHSPYLLFIIDEGDAIPDEVYRGIESCMSGGHARLLIMFNPRSEMGEVFRMERDNRANVVSLSAFRHPNVISGNDEIPGAVTREKTVERIHKWCRKLQDDEIPDSQCFELPGFLVGATASRPDGQAYPSLGAGFYKIIEPAFSYMVLGEYPAVGSSQLIAREWVSRARMRWKAYVSEYGETPPEGVQPIAGLDVAEFGADANIFLLRYGGFVAPARSWAGVDPLVTADTAADHANGLKPLRINTDATGIGASVAPSLVRMGLPGIPVKVASSPTVKSDLGEFKILRDQLWWAVREWLRTDPSAMLPPDEMLSEELLIPDYTKENGKIRVMSKDVMKEKLKRSPDRADALCLTFYEPDLLFPGASDDH